MRHLFDDLSSTPSEHFKLLFYTAVLHLLRHVVPLFDGTTSEGDAFAHFPFLIGYSNELAARGLAGFSFSEAEAIWREEVSAWEDHATRQQVDLPLVRLKQAAHLSDDMLLIWFLCGLAEEDPRFGAVFAAIQSGNGGNANVAGPHRVGIGLLMAWQAEGADSHAIRESIAQLQRLGLLHPINPDAPRTEWLFGVPAVLWDAAAGHVCADLADWAGWVPHAQLPVLDELILPDDVRAVLARLPALAAAQQLRVLTVRGPQHNGRRTALSAVARALGKGVLHLHVALAPGDSRWRWVGPLATLLNAMPVFALDLGPGENYGLPDLNGYVDLVGVALGQQGGLAGWGIEQSVTLTLTMPFAAARQQHWQASLPDAAEQMHRDFAARWRLTGGNIRRAARLAKARAALQGHAEIDPDDMRQATHSLGQQALDSLATFVPPLSTTAGECGWNQLAVSAEGLAELKNLAARCRHREALPDWFRVAGQQINAGVRALFGGPSGTGKTLAARVLAAALNMDLYRLDLSLVVNKYIGETEKNLSRIFARAEELDVMLLLDEGDALLTQRTQVQNSNDRYANLETNFLLQRLETFEGVLVVTTNASERIDGAFARRMDVVIDFRAPEACERRHIWELHLPAAHASAIPNTLLDEVAGRCALTGGQIRNAALHASVLALNNGGVVQPAYVLAAVQREYRKMGAACPLRGGS